MYTKRRLNREERLNRQAIAQEWMVEEESFNPVLLVLLIALASLIAGLIPVAYTLSFGKAQSQTSTIIVAGEAGIWSVLGEK